MGLPCDDVHVRENVYEGGLGVTPHKPVLSLEPPRLLVTNSTAASVTAIADSNVPVSLVKLAVCDLLRTIFMQVCKNVRVLPSRYNNLLYLYCKHSTFLASCVVVWNILKVWHTTNISRLSLSTQATGFTFSSRTIDLVVPVVSRMKQFRYVDDLVDFDVKDH